MRYRDENGFALMGWNPHIGATYWEKVVDGKRVIRTDFDAEPILAGNKAAQAEFAGRRWSDGLGDPVASIPMNIYMEELLPMEQQGDKKAVARWLNDSDNAQWRMKQGRV